MEEDFDKKYFVNKIRIQESFLKGRKSLDKTVFVVGGIALIVIMFVFNFRDKITPLEVVSLSLLVSCLHFQLNYHVPKTSKLQREVEFMKLEYKLKYDEDYEDDKNGI